MVTLSVLKKKATEIWLPILENCLSKFGEKPKFWDVYREDNFQFETNVENALIATL